MNQETDYLRRLDARLHYQTHDRKTGVVIDHFTDVAITPEETDRLIGIIRAQRLACRKIATPQGIGYEVSDIVAPYGMPEPLPLLRFDESQLPGRFDRTLLESVYERRENLALLNACALD